MTKSSLPSPLKSAVAMEAGLMKGPQVTNFNWKVPSPLPVRIEIAEAQPLQLPSPPATAISSLPSPLKSPTATQFGLVPTALLSHFASPF